ncbi:hypothetical protein KIF53_20010 [Chromobacterium subtsugae]|uniref:50S ribosomal protein L2 n=2 Tax=Chromobacterium subtsugae TaxID=251747 RepID=A0ABS7FIM2_9NEIS|nr:MULTISPECIES: hypothetical protein [Chromobacterium]MBW7566559.1 hypothetical protein [Chromobacterium subtsugae]MBW8289928.1 hypothetical protein [Chromobacterium subtsugae]WSE92140.1 hypothetical protein U6115_02535 [Chromobacterium subtsugae]WVH60514.1 hypothetical protein U6151_02535 [Chromobacterium subtsugae]
MKIIVREADTKPHTVRGKRWASLRSAPTYTPAKSQAILSTKPNRLATIPHQRKPGKLGSIVGWR